MNQRIFPLCQIQLPGAYRGLLCLALIGLAATLAFSGCDASHNGDTRSTSEDDAHMTKLAGFEFTLCEQGMQKLRVTSKETRMTADHVRALLSGVRIVRLQDGVASGTITAREGTYYLKDSDRDKRQAQDLVLNGSVLVQRPDGFTLRSDKALIQSKDKKLIADANSTLHYPMKDNQMLVGQATRFELDLLDGFNTATFVFQGTPQKNATLQMPMNNPAPAGNAVQTTKTPVAVSPAKSNPSRAKGPKKP